MNLRAEDFKPMPVASTRRGRVHRLEDDGEVPLADEPQPIQEEITMPRGVYDRTKAKRRKTGAQESASGAKAGETPEAATTSRKARKGRGGGRGARTTRRASIGREFGVFSDGSVQINTSECKGNLLPEEAAALVEFIQRLKK